MQRHTLIPLACVRLALELCQAFADRVTVHTQVMVHLRHLPIAKQIPPSLTVGDLLYTVQPIIPHLVPLVVRLGMLIEKIEHDNVVEASREM